MGLSGSGKTGEGESLDISWDDGYEMVVGFLCDGIDGLPVLDCIYIPLAPLRRLHTSWVRTYLRDLSFSFYFQDTLKASGWGEVMWNSR